MSRVGSRTAELIALMYTRRLEALFSTSLLDGCFRDVRAIRTTLSSRTSELAVTPHEENCIRGLCTAAALKQFGADRLGWSAAVQGMIECARAIHLVIRDDTEYALTQ